MRLKTVEAISSPIAIKSVREAVPIWHSVTAGMILDACHRWRKAGNHAWSDHNHEAAETFAIVTGYTRAMPDSNTWMDLDSEECCSRRIKSSFRTGAWSMHSQSIDLARDELGNVLSPRNVRMSDIR
jgi:hypothetical protein